MWVCRAYTQFEVGGAGPGAHVCKKFMPRPLIYSKVQSSLELACLEEVCCEAGHSFI